jgi:mannose-6-phosphate isomerase-like protein (cupin superfamily)
MQETIKEVAGRIKELRGILGIGVKEMASDLKPSQEKYQKYENGEVDIPASVLYEISRKLGIEMGILLTREAPRMHYFTATRKGKGAISDRRKQYRYENPAPNFINKKAEPFIVTVEPKPANAKVQTNNHPGQEFNYVIEGSLKLLIKDREIILEKGDSIYFDSSRNHAMVARNDKPARFLAIIM